MSFSEGRLRMLEILHSCHLTQIQSSQDLKTPRNAPLTWHQMSSPSQPSKWQTLWVAIVARVRIAATTVCPCVTVINCVKKFVLLVPRIVVIRLLIAVPVLNVVVVIVIVIVVVLCVIVVVVAAVIVVVIVRIVVVAI
eukprot:PhF_6_TR10586/c0_g1_i1/m.16936